MTSTLVVAVAVACNLLLAIECIRRHRAHHPTRRQRAAIRRVVHETAHRILERRR